MSLTFEQFSEINRARCRAWMGEADTVEHHLIGLVGEVGELCNEWKKEDRVAHNRPGSPPCALRRDMGNELADVIIYCDLVAKHYEIDLEEALISKFNATSERYGFPHRLPS